MTSFDASVPEIRSTLRLPKFSMESPNRRETYLGAPEDAVVMLQHRSAIIGFELARAFFASLTDMVRCPLCF